MENADLALFQRRQAAVKIHALLDLRGSIPSFIRVTSAHGSDVSVLDDLVPHPGACYVMDRGYIHFARLYRLTTAAAYFVVRARKNMQYRRRYSHRVGKIQARHERVADLYRIEVVETEQGPRVNWQRIAERQAWQQAREGAYLLRTNLPDTDPEQLGNSYI